MCFNYKSASFAEETMTLKIFEEKTIEIPEAIIHCRSDGIIHVTFKDDVEVDIPLQLRMLKIYIEYCGNTKRPFMFSAFNNVTVTKEARENAVKIEPNFPALAAAVVADSLPYRLIANFYVNINKPKKPYKIFKDIEQAAIWLKGFIE